MPSHIYVMYNKKYRGQFKLSRAALTEYRRRCQRADHVSSSSVSRHDPVMVEILREMRAVANGKKTRISLMRIPAEYKFYYYLTSHRGREDVSVDYTEYKMDAIKSILQDRMLSKVDKLARITAVAKMEDPESEPEIDCY